MHILFSNGHSHWQNRVKEYLNFLNSTQDHSFLHTIYKYMCTRRPEYFKGIFNFKELQVKVLSYILYRSACYTCYRWNDDFKHGNLNFRCNIFVEYTIYFVYLYLDYFDMYMIYPMRSINKSSTLLNTTIINLDDITV